MSLPKGVTMIPLPVPTGVGQVYTYRDKEILQAYFFVDEYSLVWKTAQPGLTVEQFTHYFWSFQRRLYEHLEPGRPHFEFNFLKFLKQSNSVTINEYALQGPMEYLKEPNTVANAFLHDHWLEASSILAKLFNSPPSSKPNAIFEFWFRAKTKEMGVKFPSNLMPLYILVALLAESRANWVPNEISRQILLDISPQ